jgi:transposase
MPSQGKYPDELRERAVRIVLDHEDEYGSQWQAICSVAEKLGPKSETVRLWVRRAEAYEGRRPGPTSDQLAELKRLKRENAELRRANDMAESTGERTGPVTIGVFRSRERCLGWDPHARAEAARVSSSSPRVAAR